MGGHGSMVAAVAEDGGGLFMGGWRPCCLCSFTSPYHIESENHGLGHKDDMHSSTYFYEKYII